MAPKGSDRWRKDILRKRVKTAKPRAKRLGVDCRIVTGFFYYSLAHKVFDGVFHVPEGQTIPDLNQMAQDIMSRDSGSGASRAALRRSPRRRQSEAPRHGQSEAAMSDADGREGDEWSVTSSPPNVTGRITSPRLTRRQRAQRQNARRQGDRRRAAPRRGTRRRGHSTPDAQTEDEPAASPAPAPDQDAEGEAETLPEPLPISTSNMDNGIGAAPTAPMNDAWMQDLSFLDNAQMDLPDYQLDDHEMQRMLDLSMDPAHNVEGVQQANETGQGDPSDGRNAASDYGPVAGCHLSEPQRHCVPERDFPTENNLAKDPHRASVPTNRKTPARALPLFLRAIERTLQILSTS